MACTIKIWWYTTNVTDTFENCASIQVADQTTTLTGADTKDIGEWPMTVITRMAPAGEHVSRVGPNKISMREIEGDSFFVHGSDYTAWTGQSPNKTPRLHIAIANGSDVDAITVNYTVELTYHTMFYSPKIAARST